MNTEEILRIENEIFTKLVIDELKKQKANGITEFLLDKFEIDRITKERLRRILLEPGS